MQVPDGAITACQYGPYVCVADTCQYKIIDLSAKRMEILYSYEPAVNSDIFKLFKPIITVIGEGEFLLTLPANTGHILAYKPNSTLIFFKNKLICITQNP